MLVLKILAILLGLVLFLVLGVFLRGMLTRSRGNDAGNVLAMLAGFAAVITLEILGSRDLITHIAFPWRVTTGTIVTFAVGCLFRTRVEKNGK